MISGSAHSYSRGAETKRAILRPRWRGARRVTTSAFFFGWRSNKKVHSSLSTWNQRRKFVPSPHKSVSFSGTILHAEAHSWREGFSLRQEASPWRRLHSTGLLIRPRGSLRVANIKHALFGLRALSSCCLCCRWSFQASTKEARSGSECSKLSLNLFVFKMWGVDINS